MAYRAEPAFALIKIDGGGSIGLLSMGEARKEGAGDMTPAQRRAIHVELSVDNLVAAHQELLERGMTFHAPPGGLSSSASTTSTPRTSMAPTWPTI